eukprot:GHVH01010442.1.p1 GENE.GHVH01010442.1~~GHVH01010442.1.p1  ORF type:complete len:107 (-),score=16.59 GHVH01010442.1:431-751(-)
MSQARKIKDVFYYCEPDHEKLSLQSLHKGLRCFGVVINNTQLKQLLTTHDIPEDEINYKSFQLLLRSSMENNNYLHGDSLPRDLKLLSDEKGFISLEDFECGVSDE